MISIRRAMRRFALRRKKISSFDVATEEDLYYCYRLLLGREPDQEGWDQGKKLLNSMEFPLAALVDEFLSSPEYRANLRNADQPVLVELDEFKIYIRRNDYLIGAVIEKVRSYEPHVTTQVRSRLREGDVFVDIGANIGYFTLLAAKIVGPEGQVHAFEPFKKQP